MIRLGCILLAALLSASQASDGWGQDWSVAEISESERYEELQEYLDDQPPNALLNSDAPLQAQDSEDLARESYFVLRRTLIWEKSAFNQGTPEARRAWITLIRTWSELHGRPSIEDVREMRRVLLEENGYGYDPSRPMTADESLMDQFNYWREFNPTPHEVELMAYVDRMSSGVGMRIEEDDTLLLALEAALDALSYGRFWFLSPDEFPFGRSSWNQQWVWYEKLRKIWLLMAYPEDAERASRIFEILNSPLIEGVKLDGFDVSEDWVRMSLSENKERQKMWLSFTGRLREYSDPRGW